MWSNRRPEVGTAATVTVTVRASGNAECEESSCGDVSGVIRGVTIERLGLMH